MSRVAGISPGRVSGRWNQPGPFVGSKPESPSRAKWFRFCVASGSPPARSRASQPSPGRGAVRPHQVQRDARPVRPRPSLQCTATAPRLGGGGDGGAKGGDNGAWREGEVAGNPPTFAKEWLHCRRSWFAVIYSNGVAGVAGGGGCGGGWQLRGQPAAHALADSRGGGAARP